MATRYNLADANLNLNAAGSALMNSLQNFPRIIFLAVTFLMVPPGIGSELLTDAEDFFEATFGDLQEELDLMQEEGKSHLLVMFETKDCPWCKRMKKQVLNRVKVQDYFQERFRIISLDAEGDVLLTDFNGEDILEKDFALKVLRVRATPVFVFFEPSGDIATKYTGAMKNAEDFILLGQYVDERRYEQMGFNKYKRNF